MRQSEHVLYITLIDFLLQLIFLGMVIGVIYAAARKDEESAEAVLMREVQEMTGVSDLTELTDLLTRLGPIRKAVKEKEKADSKKTRPGLPSCLPDNAMLATFHAHRDRIELGAHNTAALAAMLGKLGLPKTAVESVAVADFPRLFAPVKMLYPDCRFNVRVIEHSYDTRPRDAVRQAFMAYPRRAAGF